MLTRLSGDVKRPLGVLTLLCAALVTAGCGGTGSDRLDGEIKIGVAIELSGPASQVGAAHRNALNLAAEEINRKGVRSKRIALVIRDNKSDGKEAAARVAQLIDKDKVAAVIGSGLTATTLPMIETVQRRKVPLVSMGFADEIVTPASERSYVFKTPPNAAAVVDALLPELAATGAKTVGVLAAAGQYGETGLKALRAGAERARVDVRAVERFNPDDRDPSGAVNALVRAQPNAIIVWCEGAAGAATAAKAIKDSAFLDRGGRVYFDPGAGGDLFVRAASTASENMLMVHPTVLAANQITANTPSALAQKEFFTKYTQKYGTFSGLASYSVDALRLIVAAIEQAGSADRQKVRDALESLRYDGMTGSYEFGPDNHGGVGREALSVLAVRRGGWVIA